VVLVFGLAFVGCGGGGSKNDDDDDDDDDGDLVERTVFELATDEGIQALALGTITFPAGDDPNTNPIKPLVRAGGDAHVTIEVVTSGDHKGLKFTTIADWGAGIDLRYAAFGLREGDKITITGEKLGGTGRVQVNNRVGQENATINSVDTRKTADGEFTIEFTLDAAAVTALRAGDPAGLRIEGRPVGIIVRIDNIKIVGMRPSNVVALAAPEIEATATGVRWTAIEGAGGYKVFKDADTTPITTEGPSATSTNLSDLSALPDGTYSITVVAAGIAGVSSDSAKSNAVSFTKYTPPPPSIKVKVNSVEQNAEIKRTKGTVDIFEDATGYTFTYPTEGSNINYTNSYAYYKVNLGSKKVNEIVSIKFTLLGAGGATPESGGYKKYGVAAWTTEPSAYFATDSGNVIAIYDNYGQFNGDKNLTYGMKANDSSSLTTINATVANATGVIYLSVWINSEESDSGATTAYKVSNIELVF